MSMPMSKRKDDSEEIIVDVNKHIKRSIFKRVENETEDKERKKSSLSSNADIKKKLEAVDTVDDQADICSDGEIEPNIASFQTNSSPHKPFISNFASLVMTEENESQLGKSTYHVDADEKLEFVMTHGIQPSKKEKYDYQNEIVVPGDESESKSEIPVKNIQETGKWQIEEEAKGDYHKNLQSFVKMKEESNETNNQDESSFQSDESFSKEQSSSDEDDEDERKDVVVNQLPGEGMQKLRKIKTII